MRKRGSKKLLGGATPTLGSPRPFLVTCLHYFLGGAGYEIKSRPTQTSSSSVCVTSLMRLYV